MGKQEKNKQRRRLIKYDVMTYCACVDRSEVRRVTFILSGWIVSIVILCVTFIYFLAVSFASIFSRNSTWVLENEFASNSSFFFHYHCKSWKDNVVLTQNNKRMSEFHAGEYTMSNGLSFLYNNRNVNAACYCRLVGNIRHCFHLSLCVCFWRIPRKPILILLNWNANSFLYF